MKHDHETLRAYAHAVGMKLLGCLVVHEADPELAENLAEEFEHVTREHLAGCLPECGVRGVLALERLLDELETDAPAETTAH